MITWKHQIESLKHIVDWVWLLDVAAGDEIDSMPQLVPNVNAHYIITPIHQHYYYRNKSDHFCGIGNHLLTPSTQTLVLKDEAPLIRLGIRFTPTVFYQLSEHAWGKGIATLACQFMTRLAFDHLSAHKVTADCYVGNVGSYKTMEKCGYQHEGTQKGYYKLEDGFEDRVLYGITKERFDSLNR
ncbi:GNAT family N-acetyltransferase [Vibrio sp. ZSDE26]|uniref:GNAT family N-acetyltransferase n=1 Tax=Vibrio amylolyticus TaxID=2847292 RepID=A0A9X1XIH1_9VIBR|nr:GNAT family protein [Vibrio amylolyticus]MCK6263401.1 GNAT family N-acetyltransferase [Vibrio amylolyticus]